MQTKRGFRFLLVLTLQIFFLAISVHAAGFFQGLSYGAFPSFGSFYGLYTSPVQFYMQYSGWIDLFLIVALFSMLGRIFGDKHFGGEKGIGVGGLLGFTLGLSLSLMLNSIRFDLLDLGALNAFIVVILALFGAYKWATGGENKSPYSLIALIVIILLALMLFIPGLLNYLPFGQIILFVLYAIFGILFLILLARLGWGLINLLNFRRGSGSGGSSGGPTNAGGGSSGGSGNGPKKSGEKLRVNILLTPKKDDDRYSIGDTINLYANVSRGMLRRTGNTAYYCTWFIGNRELKENNQNLTYQLNPGDVTSAEQKLQISVVVRDLTNPNSQGRAVIEIIAISSQASINVKNSGTLIDITQGDNTPVEFEYEITGNVPNDISTINWFIFKGRQTVINDAMLKTAVRQVETINNFEMSRTFDLPFSNPPLDLPKGVYTVAAVALKKKSKIGGGGNILWQGYVNSRYIYLMDAFYLNVKGSKTTPSTPSSSSSLECVALYDDSKPRNRILDVVKDGDITYDNGRTLYFIPYISAGGNLDNYDVEYEVKKTIKGDKFIANASYGNAKQIGILRVGNEEEKVIITKFSKGGVITKVIKITVKINKAGTSNPTPTNPELRIVRVNNNTVNTGDEIDAEYDKEISFETFIYDSRLIDEIGWFAYDRAMNRIPLGSVNSNKFNFTHKFNFTFDKFTFKEDEYAIAAYGYKNKAIVKDNKGGDLLDNITLKFTSSKNQKKNLKIDFLQIVPKDSGIKPEHMVIDSSNPKGVIKELVTYMINAAIDWDNILNYKIIAEYDLESYNRNGQMVQRTVKINAPFKLRYLTTGLKNINFKLLDNKNNLALETVIRINVETLPQTYIAFDSEETVIPNNTKTEIKLEVKDEAGLIKEFAWILYDSILRRNIIKKSRSSNPIYQINSTGLDKNKTYYLVAYALKENAPQIEKLSRNAIEKLAIAEGSTSILIKIK